MDNKVIQEIDNFLTKEECDELIKLIDLNNQPSYTVSDFNNKQSSDFRTSSTSNLKKSNDLVSKIHTRIANYLNLDIDKGESLQGQLYEVGQYFKPHNDFFSKGPTYERNCLSSGNRTHTFMIYLNEDMEGGETDFPLLGLKFKPKTGKAITWLNMKNKSTVPESMHEGCPILSGKKYVITSWWRERKHDGRNDEIKFKELNKIKQYYFKPNDGEPYTKISQLPKCSDSGFKIIKCPQDVWNIVTEGYEKYKHLKQEEVFNNKNSIIIGKGITSEMIPVWRINNFVQSIHSLLKPIHEEFCNRELIPSFIYGIRSYLNGSSLMMHRDKIQTHHISSILIVDKNLNGNSDWPLDIVDHNGKQNKVYAEVGDLILYESAICKHGRIETFQGEYFRNMFIHYQFAK